MRFFFSFLCFDLQELVLRQTELINILPAVYCHSQFKFTMRRNFTCVFKSSQALVYSLKANANRGNDNAYAHVSQTEQYTQPTHGHLKKFHCKAYYCYFEVNFEIWSSANLFSFTAFNNLIVYRLVAFHITEQSPVFL